MGFLENVFSSPTVIPPARTCHKRVKQFFFNVLFFFFFVSGCVVGVPLSLLPSTTYILVPPAGCFPTYELLGRRYGIPFALALCCLVDPLCFFCFVCTRAFPVRQIPLFIV